MSSLLFWVPVVVVVLVLQSIFVYRQAKAFSRRIYQLRHEGRVAVGLGRRRFHGRTFVVVVANRQNRVVKVEELSGWSVFARPRLLPRYAGLPLAELPEVVRAEKPSPQFQAAVDQAVKALLEPELSTEGTVMPTNPVADDAAKTPEEEEGGGSIANPV